MRGPDQGPCAIPPALCVVYVALRLHMPECFFAIVMAHKKGKRRNCGRCKLRAATAHRRLRGGERLRGPLRGLLARWPVRRVLLATAAKNFFEVDIPEALALAVLREAALHIARRLHGKPPQALRPEGTPNVKPPGQHHMCSHKWQVVYQLGTVHLTMSRHCMHEGRHLPYVFVQGSLRPVLGVAHVFDS